MTFSPADSLQGQSQAWHGRHPMPPAASPRCHQCWDWFPCDHGEETGFSSPPGRSHSPALSLRAHAHYTPQ